MVVCYLLLFIGMVFYLYHFINLRGCSVVSEKSRSILIVLVWLLLMIVSGAVCLMGDKSFNNLFFMLVGVYILLLFAGRFFSWCAEKILAAQRSILNLWCNFEDLKKIFQASVRNGQGLYSSSDVKIAIRAITFLYVLFFVVAVIFTAQKFAYVDSLLKGTFSYIASKRNLEMVIYLLISQIVLVYWIVKLLVFALTPVRVVDILRQFSSDLRVIGAFVGGFGAVGVLLSTISLYFSRMGAPNDLIRSSETTLSALLEVSAFLGLLGIPFAIVVCYYSSLISLNVGIVYKVALPFIISNLVLFLLLHFQNGLRGIWLSHLREENFIFSDNFCLGYLEQHSMGGGLLSSDYSLAVADLCGMSYWPSTFQIVVCHLLFSVIVLYVNFKRGYFSSVKNGC